MRAWWAKSGHNRLVFHRGNAHPGREWIFQTDNEGVMVWARVDLSILDRKASKADAEVVAKRNLELILAETAKYLGIDGPL